MINWTCKGCGCDYNYMEPELVVNGKNYCAMCSCSVDDKTASENSSVSYTITLLMVISFLFGVVIGMWLRN